MKNRALLLTIMAQLKERDNYFLFLNAQERALPPPLRTRVESSAMIVTGVG